MVENYKKNNGKFELAVYESESYNEEPAPKPQQQSTKCPQPKRKRKATSNTASQNYKRRKTSEIENTALRILNDLIPVRPEASKILNRTGTGTFHPYPCMKQTKYMGMPTHQMYNAPVCVGGYFYEGRNNKQIYGIAFCALCGFERGLKENANRCAKYQNLATL